MTFNLASLIPARRPTARQSARQWAGAAALAFSAIHGGTGSALASVNAVQPPPENPIERSSLAGATPRVSGPDDPAREKILQTLRRAAQSGDGPSRKPRPSAGRATADMPPADAAWLLGLLALHGLAMPTDLPQAQHWFEIAQMLGHPLAPAGLAWCQLSGCVGSPNPTAALHWIALVRRADHGLAKYLEWHASKALAPLIDPKTEPPSRDAGALAPPSSPALQKMLLEASRSGNAQASNELGLEYLAAGNLEQALAEFNAASSRSEAAAANAKLLISRIKSGPTTRDRFARYSPADWYAQARRYHRGDGVPANYTEAVRLYQIAAAGGDPQARRMLAMIFSRPSPDGTLDVTWMQQLAAIELSPSGLPQSAAVSTLPQSWHRDPSPLYGAVPEEWRSTGATPKH
jgi:uncharacterized protein